MECGIGSGEPVTHNTKVKYKLVLCIPCLPDRQVCAVASLLSLPVRMVHSGGREMYWVFL